MTTEAEHTARRMQAITLAYMLMKDEQPDPEDVLRFAEKVDRFLLKNLDRFFPQEQSKDVTLGGTADAAR